VLIIMFNRKIIF